MAQYNCPRGCKRYGKPIPITSIRGWKKHMTQMHKEWTDDELAAIVGAGATDPVAGKDQFLSEIDRAPAADESPAADGKAESAKPTDKKKAAPEPDELVYIPLRSKKLRKFTASFINKVVAEGKIHLDEEDLELIDEAFDQLEEMYPIVFALKKKDMVIHNRLAAAIIPLSKVAMVYVKHTFSWEWFKDLFKKDEEPKPPESVEPETKPVAGASIFGHKP